MGQRYIDALSQQAKPENMFLLRQSVEGVSDAVDNAINLLDMKTDGKASIRSYESHDEPESYSIDHGVDEVVNEEAKVAEVEASGKSRAEQFDDLLKKKTE